MASYVTVIVTDRKTGRGKSGVSVSSQDSNQTTDDNGHAILSFSGRNAVVYVDGTKIFDDFASNCPSVLTYSV